MRATQAPEQWRKLLDAVDNKDYDLAHRICVTYKFNGISSSPTEKNAPVGHYVAMAPDGKLICHEISNQLSEYLGFSYAYVQVRVNKYSHQTITRGKMKGWSFWRN